MCERAAHICMGAGDQIKLRREAFAMPEVEQTERANNKAKHLKRFLFLLAWKLPFWEAC